MSDERQWAMALAKFEAFLDSCPTYYREETVQQYNDIVAELETASGESFSGFKIPPNKVKPKIASTRPGGYGGGPSVIYSKDSHCDPAYFNSQSDGLRRYLQSFKTNRAPVTEQRAKAHATGSIHIKNMYSSSIQHGSPGAIAHITFQNNDPHLIELIAKIKGSIDQLELSASSRDELAAQVKTIEAQIVSPRPIALVITECLRSARTIIEGAAMKAISSGLVTEISKFLPG
jgi:hypothetical protein